MMQARAHTSIMGDMTVRIAQSLVVRFRGVILYLFIVLFPYKMVYHYSQLLYIA